jgi:hypothetical protein
MIKRLMKEYNTKEHLTPEELREPVIDYNKVYTYADYLKLEIDEMIEIIRGKIFRMSPAPKIKHQAITRNIIGNLYSTLKGQKCQVFNSPVDVVHRCHT